MSVQSDDPCPNHCGICSEPYGSYSPTFAANSRRASKTCRHAICLECAIQHAFASNHTSCPFCRAGGAYSASEFSALLEETKQQDSADGADVVTPQVLELLEIAQTKREEAQAKMERMIAVLNAMMQLSMVEQETNFERMRYISPSMLRPNAIPNGAVVDFYIRINDSGVPSLSVAIRVSPNDAVEDESSDEASEQSD